MPMRFAATPAKCRLRRHPLLPCRILKTRSNFFCVDGFHQQVRNAIDGRAHPRRVQAVLRARLRPELSETSRSELVPPIRTATRPNTFGSLQRAGATTFHACLASCQRNSIYWPGCRGRLATWRRCRLRPSSKANRRHAARIASNTPLPDSRAHCSATTGSIRPRARIALANALANRRHLSALRPAAYTSVNITASASGKYR